MKLIFTIALRNLFRHKGKSLVIGIILFLGAFIMTIGNGIITGLNSGLQENIVNKFTGDIVLISEKQESNAVIISMMGKPIEMINNYTLIKKLLQGLPYIDKYIPLAQGTAMLLNEDGEPDFNFLLGVNFEEYQKMFGNLKVIEGRLPKVGERGLLLTDMNRKTNYEYLLNAWVIPPNTKVVTSNFSQEAKLSFEQHKLKIIDSMIFMGMNEKNSALDIKPSIIGVIKFKALNSFFGYLNLIDIESFRECFGYVTAQDSASSLDKDKSKLLAMESENLDDLFSDKQLFVQEKVNQNDYSLNNLQTKLEKKVTTNINLDNGTYNQVYIKLKPGTKLDNAVKKLNISLKKNNLGVKAITWKQALGEMADMATVIKVALFVFVMFIFFVAIIIIMNTLSMAALERIPEIGMMRAIGARKSFVALMFFYETLFMSLVFGGAGIVVGAIVIKILSLMNITTTNEMIQLVFGGDKFHPFLTVMDFVLCAIQLLIVTVIATIYPILVASRIKPLDAINRD